MLKIIQFNTEERQGEGRERKFYILSYVTSKVNDPTMGSNILLGIRMVLIGVKA